MNRPLNICVVSSTFPRSESDYAVPWMRESIRRLTDRGHRVSVLAPSYKGLADHEIDGVPVHRFRYAPSRWERLTHEEGAPSKVRNPLMQLLAAPYVAQGVRAANRLGRRERFDVVHTHWPFPHEPIGSALARSCGAPLVLNCHGAEFALARRKPWVAKLLRRSLLKGDLVVANSTDTAEHIRALSGREAVVLPYGSTVAARNRPTRPNPVPRILFTGRLIQRKGVEYLLRAVPLLLARRKVEVIITGSGDQRERLEALARELGIGHAVRFLGFVSNEELDRQYARCDLWVNPSIVDDRGDTEGLGVGAIEAYAHCKPVVASDVGGIPDAVVHGQTGLLVPEKDPRALAVAINWLLDDPVLAARLGRNGLEFARRQFCWDRITDQLEDTYLEAIAARHPAPASREPVPAAETFAEFAPA
jgi:glycosyltransferase involved in cell wall biosynthesis